MEKMNSTTSKFTRRDPRIKKAVRKFDLFKFLEDNGASFQVRSEGSYYYTECWCCGKPKLFIHSSDLDDFKGYWRCWVCGARGDIFDIIGAFEHIDRKAAFLKVVEGAEADAFTEVNPILKLEVDDWAKEDRIKLNAPIELPLNFTPIWTLNNDNVGYRYAMFRGITPDLMKKFDVRYNSLMRRVIFPITHRGEYVGWQGRAIDNETQPKLLSNAGFRKGYSWFNFDGVQDNDTIMIVEGPIDAIKGHRYGAIALLGKTMSEDQFKLLLRLPKLENIYVALDPDARREALQMSSKLSELWNVRLVALPMNKDIGGCTLAEVDYYVKTSEPHQKARLKL